MKTILAYALRELGPATLLRFGQYRLGLDSGWIRRQTPLYRWEDRPLSYWLQSAINAEPEAYCTYRSSLAPKFFIPGPAELRAQLGTLLQEQMENVIATADRIAKGFFPLFGFHRTSLGFPPDWHGFAPLVSDWPLERAASSQHWSEIDLQMLPGDVKLLWEVNRFGWIYPLVRAYTLTDDPKYFEIFWALFDSWRTQNPPNSGLNWHSAQEVSIRMLALIFAFYALQTEFEKYPDRIVSVADAIAVHADRIPPTLPYAIAQKNNHLLVEAVGLYSAGVLFPEFKRAGHWKKVGRRWLVRALRKQVFKDGGYVQHSSNYHRLALQAGLWASRLSELQGEPLPPETLARLDAMGAWMAALVDASNGAAPNFGPNDGAELFPLSCLPFDDHRPTVQAVSRMTRDEPYYEDGAWDEWSLWLGLLEVDAGNTAVPVDIGMQALPDSGLYLLSGGLARGVLRAGRFTSRPGHADQLHLDLWFGPLNVAMDPGSFLYNAEPPWDNALAGTKHHNTLLVDGSEAMTRASRFLWLNWNQARILGRWRTDDGELEVLTAECRGDQAGEVVLRRTAIRCGERHWVVVDDVLGAGQHSVDLTWLLPDLSWELEDQAIRLDTPVGQVRLAIKSEGGTMSLYRAGDCVYGEQPAISLETMGWYSPTYALKIPALQLVCRSASTLPIRMTSYWSWIETDQDPPEIGWNGPHELDLPIQWVRFEDQVLELSDAYSVDSSSFRRAG